MKLCINLIIRLTFIQPHKQNFDHDISRFKSYKLHEYMYLHESMYLHVSMYLPDCSPNLKSCHTSQIFAHDISPFKTFHEIGYLPHSLPNLKIQPHKSNFNNDRSVFKTYKLHESMY